jgi:hypothetical protein
LSMQDYYSSGNEQVAQHSRRLERKRNWTKEFW